LKAVRISVPLEPAVEIISSTAALLQIDFLSMLIASSIDMVNGQQHQVILTTTAFDLAATVVSKDFGLDFILGPCYPHPALHTVCDTICACLLADRFLILQVILMPPCLDLRSITLLILLVQDFLAGFACCMQSIWVATIVAE
jgi:hypothetical protein